jgi:hypothetical protein
MPDNSQFRGLLDTFMDGSAFQAPGLPTAQQAVSATAARVPGNILQSFMVPVQAASGTRTGGNWDPDLMAWGEGLRRLSDRIARPSLIAQAAGLTAMGMGSPFAPETAGWSEAPGAALYALGKAGNLTAGIADLAGSGLQSYETGRANPFLKSAGQTALGVLAGNLIPNKTGSALLGTTMDNFLNLLSGEPSQTERPVQR